MFGLSKFQNPTSNTATAEQQQQKQHTIKKE
jgi:hypothetical protein